METISTAPDAQVKWPPWLSTVFAESESPTTRVSEVRISIEFVSTDEVLSAALGNHAWFAGLVKQKLSSSGTAEAHFGCINPLV